MKILIFFACAGVVFAADEEDARRLPEGTGKDVVVKVCLSCHGSGNFRKLRLSEDGWSEQVADMINRGAQATESEAATVVEYLTHSFGKDSKLIVNAAPFEELKAVLGLTTEEARAIVAYRKERGEFKSVEELEKTPGLDAKKIESRKEMIAF
jgi:competence protein ComEA